MFCNKCGSQIPDGSPFCNSCGSSQNGFGGAAPYLTKKEYFRTACSDKAKKLMKAGRTVLLVCAVFIVLSMVASLVGMRAVLDEVDFDNDIKTVLTQIEEIAGESIGISEADLEMFQSLEAEFKQESGMTLSEFMEIIIYVLWALQVIITAVIVLLSFLALRNIGLASSIVALVLAVLSGGGLVELGLTVTILVFVCMLRKEYKAYSENPYSFTNNTFEPDFSN